MSRTSPLGRLTAKVRATLRGPKVATPDSRRTGKDTGPTGDELSGTGGVAVSYAPERDGDADPGEVVWTWVAYEDDPGQGKDRPVLVLGYDGDRLAGVQLSTKDHTSRRDSQEWVPVGTGGWDRTARPSFADASRLLRIDPAKVRREGSALDEARFRAVLARVTELHDWHA